MKYRHHWNAIPARRPETLEMLAGGHRIIAHWLSDQDATAWSGRLVYIDAERNIAVHMRGVAQRPAALQPALEWALREIGVKHVAVRELASKVVKRALVS